MDPIQQLTNEVRTLSEKIDTVAKAIKTIKTIFFWLMIAGVVSFVLPLIGLAFVLPQFINSYTSALNF